MLGLSVVATRQDERDCNYEVLNLETRLDDTATTTPSPLTQTTY